MSTIICPRRTDHEIEYTVERGSDGDGIYARSWWYATVNCHEILGESPEPRGLTLGTYRTSCDCWWTEAEIERLNRRATLAATVPGEEERR